MNVNKAAALDHVDRGITAEALQEGCDQMIDTIHAYCPKVYPTTTLMGHQCHHPVAKER